MAQADVRTGDHGRWDFADLLRGLAALVVTIGHYTVLFLTGPDMVATLTWSKPAEKFVLPVLVQQIYDIFNLASVGVGVFFLISGFVIPMSLAGSSISGYLVKRFLRIYPTYWAALACGVAAMFVSSAYWSRPITHGWSDYLGNIFLVTDFMGKFDMISVMWTLLIEIKFYLIAIIAYPFIKRGSFVFFFGWAAFILIGFWASTAACTLDNIFDCWLKRGWFTRFAWEGVYITFMFIGSIFYMHARGLISDEKAVLGVVFQFYVFVCAYWLSHLQEHLGAYVTAFLWGLVVFTLFYALRRKIVLRQPFRFLANISYPLYVLHPLLGYVSMRLMMEQGIPYAVALPLTLAMVMALATIVHRTVEAPTMALGKRLGKRLGK